MHGAQDNRQYLEAQIWLSQTQQKEMLSFLFVALDYKMNEEFLFATRNSQIQRVHKIAFYMSILKDWKFTRMLIDLFFREALSGFGSGHHGFLSQLNDKFDMRSLLSPEE